MFILTHVYININTCLDHFLIHIAFTFTENIKSHFIYRCNSRNGQSNQNMQKIERTSLVYFPSEATIYGQAGCNADVPGDPGWSRSRTMHPQSPALTISGTVLKESDDLYWERHLIPRWLLRSIFALFPEQLLNGLVSWGSPGECSMIDCFLGDAFGVLSCQFWSTVLQSGARLPIHTLNCWSPVSLSQWFPVSNCGVFECDIAHRRSVAILCMLYKIRCNPLHPLYGALPVPYVPVRVARGALWSHIGTLMRLLAAEPRSIAGLFFSFQYLCGTILVTPYSMVWNWLVSRAVPMPFHWPSCSLPSCLLLFSISLLSFYRLVLWGLGLRTAW